MTYFFDLLVIGVSLGMVYALVALGISFIYSGLDLVHFAHPEFYMAGAYIGLVIAAAGLSFPLALVLSMIATGVLGALVERIFYRKLTTMGGGLSVAGMGMIICGFGISIIMQNAAYLIFGAYPMKLPVDFGPALALGQIALPRGYIWIFLISFLLMAALTIFLKKTRIGLAVRTVALSKSTASLVGINVPLYISVIFLIACALAAAGGVLGSSVNFIHAQMGYVIGLKAFAAAVIGGLGNLPGAIAGGVILGLTESFGSGYLLSEYKDVYPFILLIFVLLFRPYGVFGRGIKDKA